MKDTYQFAGHTDLNRRFNSCSEWIGDLESGKAAYAWRDGIWILETHSGASTFYIARRTSVEQVVRPHDTKAARAAMQAVIFGGAA